MFEDNLVARKINKTKIEKAARLAIGVGNLILCCTDPKFQRRVKRIKSALDQLQPTPQKSPSASAPHQSSKSTGIIYLLQAGPFYKIGKTKNFDQRLKQIKLQLPYPVTVIHTIAARDISASEIFWHRKFAHQRTNGEWFTLNDAEVAEFKSHTAM